MIVANEMWNIQSKAAYRNNSVVWMGCNYTVIMLFNALAGQSKQA